MLRTVVAVIMAVLPACGSAERTPATAITLGQIVCEPDGSTRVLTSTIGPQPDGVHLEIDNRTNGRVYVYYRLEGDEGNLGEMERGLTERVVAEGPGTWRLACTSPNVFPTDDADWLPIEVVDPQGLWIPSRVDCEHPSASHPDYKEYFEGGLPKGEPRNPVGQARDIVSDEFSGWQPGDALEAAGYPEAVPRLVRVVREGRVIAVLDYRDDEQGGWFYGGIEYCEE